MIFNVNKIIIIKMDYEIRKIKKNDKKNWIKLYCEYAKFYNVSLNQEILETLWGWLHDKNNLVNGICCELEGKIIGIAHYRAEPRPIEGEYFGFIDDLFVDPDFRGKKVARKIMNHLRSLSLENNWGGIRLITNSSNKKAKRLFDKMLLR